jgi:equilibrative nucleoside transporter 1/2/3
MKMTLENPLLNLRRSEFDVGAYIRMVVLGVGYLFPIVAVFAAFDYWRYLFPTRLTVEYEVNGLYQLGSVSTVLALSVMRSINIRRRILTGFVGQFVCLSIILSFRWLQGTLSEFTLYTLLLGIALLMSVVTGILDSAILSLNSQYSPKMQEAMQIGIGCSIFVSIVYRDITKFFFSASPQSSAFIFFALTLGTVLLCIYCFVTLLIMPVSAHIPDVYHVEPDKVSLVSVLKRAWKNELVVFAQFALCAFGYPAMITAIPARHDLAHLQPHHWFQTLLLTVFTVFDMFSRFLVGFRGPLNPSNIGYTLIIRMATVPLLVLCAVDGFMASDVASVVVVASFGLLNGYLISLSLVLMNELSGFSPEELFVLGRFSAFAVNSGLCFGGLFALFLANTLGLS